MENKKPKPRWDQVMTNAETRNVRPLTSATDKELEHMFPEVHDRPVKDFYPFGGEYDARAEKDLYDQFFGSGVYGDGEEE